MEEIRSRMKSESAQWIQVSAKHLAATHLTNSPTHSNIGAIPWPLPGLPRDLPASHGALGASKSADQRSAAFQSATVLPRPR